ncbi:MAG: hypothetical protein ABIU05_11305 [Nitrospirales bacterium]
MITNLHSITSLQLYNQQRFDEILLREGTNQGRPYRDTTGNPSVGIGFNLRGSTEVRDLVFLEMEIDPNASGLSAAQRAAEAGYLDQLESATAMTYASTSAVQSALDGIMAARASNPIFAGITRITSLTTFIMTDLQMQAVFPTAAVEAEIKVDAWLSGIALSNERIALVSLAYNNLIGVNANGTFKSPSLRQALIEDNRAEAWYEIRYRSNGVPVNRQVLLTVGLANPICSISTIMPAKEWVRRKPRKCCGCTRPIGLTSRPMKANSPLSLPRTAPRFSFS